MKTISQSMGSGAVKRVELSDVIEEDWCEVLTLDLKMQCSKVLREGKFWHCRKGLCLETMAMLNQEFNLFRGLFPLKLFVTGPPGSGKTHYSTHLAQTYGIPHLKVADLIAQGYRRNDAVGDEIRKKTEELKD